MSFLSGLAPALGMGAGFLMGGPLGAGLGGILGGSLGGAMGQDEMNAANAQQAQLNRDFQERMSNTAYQRGTKDMMAAGLNPMLAYSQGGASSPGGAQAQIGNVGAASAQGASAMAGAAQSHAAVEQTRALTEKVRSETMTNMANSAYLAAQTRNLQFQGTGNEEAVPGIKARSQMDLAKMRAELGDNDNTNTGFTADVNRRKREAQLTGLETVLKGLAIPQARNISDFSQHPLGKAKPFIDQALDILGGITSAARSAAAASK